MISTLDIIKMLQDNKFLIDTINVVPGETYNNIQTDSRKIKAGQVFICIRGFINDGHEFAQNAVNNGAKLLIVEKELNIKVSQIVVINARKATALLAKLFFGDPTEKLKLIGITGTNGKTTIASILETILLDCNAKVGVIGTLGYSINGKRFSTERTTPDIIDLNKILTKMVKAKIEYVIMEVSSHALSLDRIFSLHFHSAIFTNLSQDHLDFHINLNEYTKTKFKLFENTDKAFVNIDDENGDRLFRKCSFKKYGISFNSADVTIKNYKYSFTGSQFDVAFLEKEYSIFTNLIGKFNIFNITAAFSVALDLLGTKQKLRIIIAIKNIHRIPGRLQQIPNDRGIGVFVDYAHTPDAIKNVLTTLNDLKKSKIICVFGAGGNRDRTKRSEMFQASLLADWIIITNDNPRDEEPAEIIKDIVKNGNDVTKFWIIRDRKEAIRTAIKFAEKDDLILIAGKGHEKYQEIRGKKHHFDDAEEVSKALAIHSEFNTALSLPIDPLQLELIFQCNLSPKLDQQIKHISTDSRTIKQDSLFFALKGDNFDGHDYIKDVLKKKNCLVVANLEYESNSMNVIQVKNTSEAYGRLAKIYKQQFHLTTIALTGSYGKTTTKEYLYNILSGFCPTHRTTGNENNLIGVPKSIFTLDPRYKMSILELGTNQTGEIEKLTEISDPDIGVIISIGPAHLEFLIDEDGVFQEKTALFKHKLQKKFFPADDKRFQEFSGFNFGSSSHAKYRFSDLKVENESTMFKVNEEEFTIPTPFKKYAFNAGIAVSIALSMNLKKALIQQGLNKPLQISQRMEIVKKNGITLLVDCYNANPDSMKAAIEFWRDFEPGKPHFAILGDMLELGKLTKEHHTNILKLLDKISYYQLISVGDVSREFKATAHFHKVENLISSGLLEQIPEKAVVLIKGSHSIMLEKIIGRI